MEAVLVSPSFLFMRETDPAKAAPGTVHRISDLELATRLSFFLWSSIPDDAAAGGGARRTSFHKPEVLKPQSPACWPIRASKALTDNFAGQWLFLRKLEYQKPDRRVFPDFDERLRAAMMTETEMFFDDVVQRQPQPAGLHRRQLHLPQPAAGRALRHPRRQRHRFRRVELDPGRIAAGCWGRAAS